MDGRSICGLIFSLLFGCAMVFVGCSSESGGSGDSTSGLVEQFYNEECRLCHEPGRIVDVAAQHAAEEKTVTAAIDSVTIVDGTVTVDFRLFDNGQPLALVAPSSIRFTLVRLIPGVDGDADSWQSYINTIEEPGVGPGTVSRVQATAETANAQGGVFVDNQDGTYSYTFSFDIQNVNSPVSVPYDASATHRLAMQVSGNNNNAILDFVPDGATTPLSRSIVDNASCNECHGRLGLHGGDRTAVEYCESCHNPGSTDANSGNTVDLKVMIHKIHYGANLPSVEAGGEYAIYGYRDAKHDYSHVVYPQDIRRCYKCHDGTDASTPEGDYWKNVPTMAACGSCHDNVDFSTGENHGGGAQTDNSKCVVCHPASGGAAGVTDSHVIPELEAAARFQYNIVGITNTEPGQFPVITFSVTDPSNGGAPYDILHDPEFNAPGGASRVAILIGWDTSDYTNQGSGSTPAMPISINPVAEAVDNNDGTFSVTSPVAIPATVEGSGVAAIEGHPAVESEPGVYDVRVPVKGVVQPFAVTDVTPVSRRSVVDIDNCNDCHGQLSLHGGNRNNEIQLCVICHNADATDINRRPADAAGTPDGKSEETIDFKYMIHAIHAGASDMGGFREEGIIVYGFGGSVNDFGEVIFPRPLSDCAACHSSGTFELPSFGDNVLPTSINTGSDPADPDDDTNITPIASTCSSCHDDIEAKTHMTEEGGSFEFVRFAPGSSTGEGSQEELCGPGPISAQPAGHSPRLDCCSCHGIQ